MTALKNTQPSSRHAALLLAAILAAAPAAHAAAIAAVNTFTTAGASVAADGAGSLLTTASFDMRSGANAVAFYFTAESSNTTPAFTATFAGQTMNLVSTNQNQQFSGIFYLINPSITSGTFTISTGATETNAFAYSAISLSNVGGVAGSDSKISTTTTQSTQLSLSYTTSLDGGFVLASLANNASASRPSPSYVSGNADTALFGSLAGSTSATGTNGYVSAGGGMGALHLYGDVSLAGSYTDIYSNPYSRSAYVELAFNPIPSAVPEPSAFAAFSALAALGAVTLRRRRR